MPCRTVVVLFFATLSLLVSASVYVSPGGTDSALCGSIGSPCFSLQQALNQLQTSSGYTIHMNPGTYSGANNTNLAVNVGEQLSLVGLGDSSSAAVVDCLGSASWLSIRNSSLYLANLSFMNCFSLTNGSVVNAEGGTLSASNCLFLNNTAIVGGAISLINTALTLTDCSFVGNTAFGSSALLIAGGAVALQGSPAFVQIWGCQFFANAVFQLAPQAGNGGVAAGGALFLSTTSTNTVVEITQCLFENNVILSWFAAQGGSIAAINPALSIANSTFVAGMASSTSFSAEGGHVYATGTSWLQVQNSTFSEGYVAVPSTSGSGAMYGGAFCVLPLPLASIVFLQTSFFHNDVYAPWFGVTAAYGGALLVKVADDDVSALVNVTECEFVRNGVYATQSGNMAIAGGGALFLDNCVASIANTTFRHNVALAGQLNVKGGALSISIYSPVGNLVTGCVFVNNSAASVGGPAVGGAIALEFAVSQYDTRTHIVASMFDSNHVVSGLACYGGAIFASFSSAQGLLGLKTSTFITNFAKTPSAAGTNSGYGGALYVAQKVVMSAVNVNAEGCLFSENFAQYGGAVGLIGVLHDASSPPSNFSYCNFTNNLAGFGGAIVMDTGDVIFDHCSLEHNAAIIDGGAIMTVQSYFLLYRSDVSYNTAGVVAGGIFLLLPGPLPSLVSQTLLKGNTARASGGAVVLQESAQIEIVQSLFTDNHATFEGGAIRMLVSSTAALVNCTWVCNTASSGAALYVNTATVQMSGCSFSSNVASQGGSSVALIQLGNMTISNTVFENDMQIASGGCLLAQDLSQLVVFNITCFNNFGSFGPAMLITGKATVTIRGSSFFNNTALQFGGAVAVGQQAAVMMRECVFRGNTAVSNGGGMLVGFADGSTYAGTDAAIDMTGVLFESNHAQLGGGLYIGPSLYVGLLESSFVQNVAEYGGGALFYEQRGPNIVDVVFTDNVALYGNASATLPVAIVVLAGPAVIPSGSTGVFRVAAVDAFGQIVQTPKSDTQVISIQAASSCVSGPGSRPIENGIAMFELVVSGFPSIPFNVQFGLAGSLLLSSVVNGTVGNCTAGYEQPPAGTCSSCALCKVGTYNLNANGECVSCDSTVTGCQGSQLFSFEGYWLLYDNATMSTQLYSCEGTMCSGYSGLVSVAAAPSYTCYGFDTDAQARGEVSNYCEAINNCAENRQGFMCANCIALHSDWSGKCIDCSNPAAYIVAPLLIGLTVYILLAHCLLAKHRSALVKILIDYTQIALLVVGTEYTVSIYISFVHNLVFAQPSGGSVCLFSRTFYEKQVQNFVTPLLYLAILLVLYGLFSLVLWRYRGADAVKTATDRWLIRPITSVALSVYTPITAAVVESLSCRQIGDYWVIASMPGLLCSGTRYSILQAFAVIITIVVVAGWPLGMLLFVYLRRERAAVTKFRIRWGYFYECYRPGFLWWEALVLSRRVGVVALSKIVDPFSRTFAVAMFTFAMVTTHTIVWPYQRLIDNVAEQVSLGGILLLAIVRSSRLFVTETDNMALLATVVLLVPIAVIGVLILIAYRRILLRLATALISKCRGKSAQVAKRSSVTSDDVRRGRRMTLTEKLLLQLTSDMMNDDNDQH